MSHSDSGTLNPRTGKPWNYGTIARIIKMAKGYDPPEVFCMMRVWARQELPPGYSWGEDFEIADSTKPGKEIWRRHDDKRVRAVLERDPRMQRSDEDFIRDFEEAVE